MRKAALLFLLASLAAPHGAIANDSTAELSTGGLLFVRNDDIEMRAEDLFISAAEIRVRYRFFNKSDRDVTVHVAFPMPDVKREGDIDVALPSDDPVNLLKFTTRVNGRAVAARVEQRALLGGADHTAMLTRLGIPLAPHLGATGKALDVLPRAQQQDLIAQGLAEVEEYDAGRGLERHLVPRWTLRTAFYWEQTFPAKKETVIEHRYRPSVGASSGTGLGAEHSRGEPWHEAYVRKYCIENDILNALRRASRAAGQDSPPFTEQRIDYVLKTGANWSGPIREFRLVVDKGDPGALVSFCGEGVRRIGPTRFEMRRRNFVPDGNLSILILRRRPAG